jgi:thermostable 8-oxoguanine DNA glycosylase
MKLTQETVKQKADEYSSEVSRYSDEIERINSLPAAFENESWSMDDLEWIVRWKSPRPLPEFQKNSPSEVRGKINRVVKEHRVRKKIDFLTELNGIAVRMASAFLLYIHPTEFTVLDRRAWDALHESGHLFDEFPDPPSVDDYLLYLGACRALAVEFDISLRTLDRALWIIGAE